MDKIQELLRTRSDPLDIIFEVEDLYDDAKTPIEDIATKQAVAEFQELKPKERGLVLTLIRELKKLRGGD